MRRLGAYFSLLALTLAFACNKETEGGGGGGGQGDDPVAPEGYIYLKAVSADEVHPGWTDGERFLVNGSKCGGYEFSDGSYRILVKKADKYDVLYPCDILDANMKLYLQRAQYYATGTHSAKCYPMSGSLASAEGEVSLAGLCGELRLVLSGEGNIASVGVRDLSGGKLCGTYTLQGSPASLKDDSVISLDEITLNCTTKTGVGVPISASGTAFNLILPARAYSSGLCVTVSTVDNHAVQFDIPAFTLAKGKAFEYKKAFAVPGDQLFAFHFDNFSRGSDPVAGRRGFKSSSLTSPEGFDFSLEATAQPSDPGSEMFTRNKVNGQIDMPAAYVASRRIGDFTLLSMVQEFNGYMGCGVNGESRCDFKFPKMSGIPAGKVCKAEIIFRLAMQADHSVEDIDFFRNYSSTGKVLELWIDGVKKADYTPSKVTTEGSGTMGDLTRWSSAFDHMGIEKGYYSTNTTVERVRLKPGDVSDWKWHDVRILMGAVTSSTTIEMCSNTQVTNRAAFFIDDIVAKRIDYDISKVDIILPISTFMAGNNSGQCERLKNEGRFLGYTEYIDLPIGSGVFFESGKHGNWLPDATIKANIAAYVNGLKNIGYKVWQIHLPATDCTNNYNDDFFEYFSPTEATRLAAVERTRKIIEYLKPLEARCLTIHATQEGRNSTATDYRYENARDRGVESFKALVAYANTITYSNGSHPIVCIENIQNSGTKYYNVCAKPEYMNYYCAQVPGLKICFDTGHAIVCAKDASQGTPFTSEDYLRVLGTNVECLHIHGNGHNDVDRHCHCGYKNGLYSNTCGNDLIDWAKVYDVLVHDCGYRGPFTYETGSSAADHIDSYSNLAHNYYEVVLSRYNKSR